MATDSLTATPSGGSQTQTTTQSPQSASGGNFGAGQQSGSVQPGTATDVLNSQNGTPLRTTSLTTVNLSASTSAKTAAPTPVKKQHHVSPGLFAISVILAAVAVALFWSAARPVENTTE